MLSGLVAPRGGVSLPEQLSLGPTPPLRTRVAQQLFASGTGFPLSMAHTMVPDEAPRAAPQPAPFGLLPSSGVPTTPPPPSSSSSPDVSAHLRLLRARLSVSGAASEQVSAQNSESTAALQESAVAPPAAPVGPAASTSLAPISSRGGVALDESFYDGPSYANVSVEGAYPRPVGVSSVAAAATAPGAAARRRVAGASPDRAVPGWRVAEGVMRDAAAYGVAARAAAGTVTATPGAGYVSVYATAATAGGGGGGGFFKPPKPKRPGSGFSHNPLASLAKKRSQQKQRARQRAGSADASFASRGGAGGRRRGSAGGTAAASDGAALRHFQQMYHDNARTEDDTTSAAPPPWNPDTHVSGYFDLSLAPRRARAAGGGGGAGNVTHDSGTGGRTRGAPRAVSGSGSDDDEAGGYRQQQQQCEDQGRQGAGGDVSFRTDTTARSDDEDEEEEEHENAGHYGYNEAAADYRGGDRAVSPLVAVAPVEAPTAAPAWGAEAAPPSSAQVQRMDELLRMHAALAETMEHAVHRPRSRPSPPQDDAVDASSPPPTPPTPALDLTSRRLVHIFTPSLVTDGSLDEHTTYGPGLASVSRDGVAVLRDAVASVMQRLAETEAAAEGVLTGSAGSSDATPEPAAGAAFGASTMAAHAARGPFHAAASPRDASSPPPLLLRVRTDADRLAEAAASRADLEALLQRVQAAAAVEERAAATLILGGASDDVELGPLLAAAAAEQAAAGGRVEQLAAEATSGGASSFGVSATLKTTTAASRTGVYAAPAPAPAPASQPQRPQHRPPPSSSLSRLHFPSRAALRTASASACSPDALAGWNAAVGRLTAAPPSGAAATFAAYAEEAKRTYRVSNATVLAAGLDPVGLVAVIADELAEELVGQLAGEMVEATETLAQALVETL